MAPRKVPSGPLIVRWQGFQPVSGTADIGRDAWDQVANPSHLPFDPFLSWDFLDALETTGAAVPETGWNPC
ncbi:MAG: peptidogalycan biosysnthesis protein, partial [Pseudomonadota bacterium]